MPVLSLLTVQDSACTPTVTPTWILGSWIHPSHAEDNELLCFFHFKGWL